MNTRRLVYLVRRVVQREVNALLAVQPLQDLRRLVEAEASVVDQDGVEAVADRTLHEDGRHRRVDAA